jgi:hypothetical protein
LKLDKNNKADQWAQITMLQKTFVNAVTDMIKNIRMKLHDIIAEIKVALMLMGPVTAIAIILTVCTVLAFVAEVL